MATTQKARKIYVCQQCNRNIEKGEHYYKHSPRYGSVKIRCSEHPFKRSDLTTSDYLGFIYDTQDEFNLDSNEFTLPDELSHEIENIVSELETMKDDLEGRLENMPESLQYSPNGELLQERIDCLDNVISELESIDCDNHEEDEYDIEDYVNNEELLEDVENDNTDKVNEIIVEIQSAIDQLE